MMVGNEPRGDAGSSEPPSHSTASDGAGGSTNERVPPLPVSGAQLLDDAEEADLERYMHLRSVEPGAWTCEEVADWLVEKGFAQYRDAFLVNDVTGSILLKMERGSLGELVPSLGHRIALLDEIEKLRGPKVPRHVGEGVVGGISGLAAKFLYGLNHLVSDPIEGASRDGMPGLLKGLGTGIAGAIQYPVEGVAVFSKQLGDGFRHTPETIFGASAVEEKPLSTWGASHTGDGTNTGSDGELLRENTTQSFTYSEGGGEGGKPAHLGEGLLIGFQRLGTGVYDGMTGLVTEPMKAANSTARETSANQGMAIARGVAKGLTGAVCKPMAGTFDFASSTVEGLIATPAALMAAAKDGPSLQDTPTYKRLSSFRIPSAETLRARLGFAPLQPTPEVVAQIEELRQRNLRDSDNHVSSD
eukprot:TRINITY_DN15983_c0_g1_i1.p1 TRINITY_DN15983_c0_g1~~TRINITY_DN15983_c0_g1_i1.p1  ORF type:complete len:415 (-),score=84.44 TRINITY_DN15983_c0_g1_i1:589-1833(-)